MGVVSGYKNDVFVSYSHLDNVPFGDPPARGWVDIFHALLENFIDVHLGQNAVVWRDKRLSGTEVFSDAIEQALRSSAVLVSVISPGYVRSDWCHRELLGFAQAANDGPAPRLGNLQRVVKVLRLPVDAGALPPMFERVLGASFFRIDPDSKRPRDLLLDPGADAQKAFNARLDDVAQDLTGMLRAMAAAGDPTPPLPAAAVLAAQAAALTVAGAERTVYLAWTTSDLAEQRHRLRREFEARGLRVVPAGEPPYLAQHLLQAAREGLQQADLVLHLIGGHYGFVPEGDTRSVVELQADGQAYAAAASHAPRIYWVAPGVPAPDARLATMLDRVQAQPGNGARLDMLVNKTLEDLKTLAMDRLNPAIPATATGPAAPGAAASGRVYLLCDQLDRPDISALHDHLFEQGLEVRLPLFEGDATDIRTEHETLLAECDGVLLYWGNAREAWLRKMLRDLNKVFGGSTVARSTPYKAKCLYIAGPTDPAKPGFRTHEVPLLRQPGAFDAAGLQPFLHALAGTP